MALKSVPTKSSQKPRTNPTSKTPRNNNVTRLSRRTKIKVPKVKSSPLWYLLRLVIVGVTLSVATGSALSYVDFNNIPFLKGKIPNIQTPGKVTDSESESMPETSASTTTPISLKQELTPLKSKLQALQAKYPKLQAGVFTVDLDNGAYVSLQGETSFSAASTIKIPVLIAFFQDVDAKKIHLNETLTMKPELIAKGSGDMQYQPANKQFTALEVATKMMQISDNTATNMIIARLGGAEELNKRFQEWGLKSTFIHNPLPDLEGTNTTSPEDLVNMLALVEKGDLLSLRSRDRMLEIMQEIANDSLLPQGLEKEAIIAHKTGDIGTILADAGIVDMPTGKRYLIGVMVKRPHNDYSAKILINDISRTVYQHFKSYQPPSFTQKPVTTTPQPTTPPAATTR